MEMDKPAWSGELKREEDYSLPEPPEYSWVREGASFQLFDEEWRLKIPRNGIEAEPVLLAKPGTGVSSISGSSQRASRMVLLACVPPCARPRAPVKAAPAHRACRFSSVGRAHHS